MFMKKWRLFSSVLFVCIFILVYGILFSGFDCDFSLPITGCVLCGGTLCSLGATLEIINQSCIENWVCTDWSDCQPNNIQTRTCVDLNNCVSQENKPSEIMSCVYDTEETAIPSGSGGGGSGARDAPSPDEITEDHIITEEIQSEIILNDYSFEIVLRQGERKTITLEMTNVGDKNLNLTFDSKNIRRFISFNKNRIILESKSTEKIRINVYSKEDEQPGLYEGEINIKSDDGKENIIVVMTIRVLEKSHLFDSKIEIEKYDILKGNFITSYIDIFNLIDSGPMILNIYYAIKNKEGIMVLFNEESIEIEKETSLKKSLEIPENIDSGEYFFYTNISYGNFSSISKEKFNVMEKQIPGIMDYERDVKLIIKILSSISGSGIAILFLFLLIKNYKLKSKNKFLIVLNQDQTKKEYIRINNTENNYSEIEISSTDEIKRFISFSKDSFRLGPKEKKIINIDFYAKKDELPKSYKGKLLIRGRLINKTFDVVIRVKK